MSKRWIVLRRWYRGRPIEIAFALALTAVALVFAAARVASAEAGSIAVTEAWARPSIGATGASAAYMTLANTGPSDDVLRALSGDVAGAVALHTTAREGGVMRMRRLEEGLRVPAGTTVRLEPGGVHAMLTGLKRKLAVGETFPLTLVFERAGEVIVQVSVRSVAPGHRH